MPRRRSGGAKAGGQGRGRKELDSDSITTPEEAGSPDSDDVGVYACDQPGCDKTFDDESGLRTHRSEMHGVFEVEKVVSHRPGASGREYRVRWLGFGARDDTWEPEEGILHIDCVQAYRRSRGLARKVKATAGAKATGSTTHPPHDPQQRGTDSDSAMSADEIDLDAERSRPRRGGSRKQKGRSVPIRKAASRSSAPMDVSDEDDLEDDDSDSFDEHDEDEDEDEEGDPLLDSDGSSDSAVRPEPEQVSHRKRKSRLMEIDGHQVLRSNNYDLENGYLKSGPVLPPKPKGAISAYTFFQQQFRKDHSDALSGLSVPDAAAIIGSAWKELDAPSRRRFEKQSTDDKKRHRRETEAWEAEKAEAEAAYARQQRAEDEREALALQKVAKKRRHTVLPKSKKRNPPKSGASHALMRHNQEMSRVMEAKAPLRKAYLRSHIETLRGFVSERTAESILAVTASQSPKKHKRPARSALPTPPLSHSAPAAACAGAAPLADAISEEELTSVLNDCTLRDYQVDGVQWLVKMYDLGLCSILGDEMGLGKTLQSIAFLGYLAKFRNENGPHLVVCPLSVMSSWEHEFNRWLPSMRVKKLHCSEAARVAVMQEISNISTYDVVITTYDMVKSTHVPSRLVRIKFRVIILDEGHCLKNEMTAISTVMRRMQCMYKLLLTGTPLQNNMHELWALMNFLLPDIFDDAEPFDSAFDLRNGVVDDEMLDKAHHMMRPFMLRRVKAEVELSLPPKKEIKIMAPLSEMQRFYYKALLTKDHAAIDGSGPGSYSKLTNLLMQLRKCCNHPFQFPGAEGPNPDDTDAADIVAASGKMQTLQKLLKHLLAKGHRVVLFSQFTMMLDVLQDWLTMLRVPYLILTGSDNRIQRKIDIHMFNAPNSKYNIFLMSTRAGGMGINLQTADTVILYDSDWNPQGDIQAMARVHRIGQKKQVHVYRLITKDTVEERVVEFAERKLYLDQMVNRGSTKNAESLDKLDSKELRNMLRFGADAILGSEHDSQGLSDKQILELIKRTTESSDADPAMASSEKEPKESMAQDAKRSVLDFDVTVPLREIRDFGGQVFTQDMSVADIGKLWNDGKSKRIRKSRTVQSGRDAVLKIDNYSALGTNISVFDYELNPSARQASAVPKKTHKEVDNESTCLNCWDGGDLVCCDSCPASYHHKCLGYTKASFERAFGRGIFSCPHHECLVCERKCGDVGGIIFRCSVCPQAYCDDHLPAEAVIIRHCQRYVNSGIDHPKQACYILCSPECAKFSKEQLLEEEPEHVSNVFDRCATAASEKAARDANAATDIEGMLKKSTPAAETSALPDIADAETMHTVLEAARFTGGIRSGKRATRNKGAVYKGEIVGMQMDEDPLYGPEAEDSDSSGSEDFKVSSSFRGTKNTEVGTPSTTTPRPRKKAQHVDFGGSARQGSPSPSRKVSSRYSSGFHYWFNINFAYFESVRLSRRTSFVQEEHVALILTKWKELSREVRLKWQASANALDSCQGSKPSTATVAADAAADTQTREKVGASHVTTTASPEFPERGVDITDRASSCDSEGKRVVASDGPATVLVNTSEKSIDQTTQPATGAGKEGYVVANGTEDDHYTTRPSRERAKEKPIVANGTEAMQPSIETRNEISGAANGIEANGIEDDQIMQSPLEAVKTNSLVANGMEDPTSDDSIEVTTVGSDDDAP